jgi:hypothetical protein
VQILSPGNQRHVDRCESAFRIAKTTAITRRAKRGLVGREDEEHDKTRAILSIALHLPSPTDIDFRDKCHLVADPEVDSVIRGSGGLRKFRWDTTGRGKHGGVRVICHLLLSR